MLHGFEIAVTLNIFIFAKQNKKERKTGACTYILSDNRLDYYVHTGF